MLLYGRMMLLMLISFYTSRVVLKALGAEDYGIYNVVGGIVGFLSFINSSMDLATSRFLSFAIGRQDNDLLNRTFRISVEIHFIISLVVVLLAETLGIWYFYTYLNIPADSYGAAMCVFQLSVLSCFIGINNVPYSALITAHEDMGIYAYISIIEAAMKLVIAFILVKVMADKLRLYAVLMFLCSFITLMIWRLYSHKKYHNVTFKLYWEHTLFMEMFSFTGWQFIGSFSWLLRVQGVALVLNFFFGPILNAARTFAVQVNAGITTFVNNFLKAVNPQIVKNYANGNLESMHLLLYRSSKFSFLLLFVLAAPVYVGIDSILLFWLKNPPEYTAIFVRLMILVTLVDSLSGTLQQCALATGKIKKYTTAVTVIMLTDIVWVYIAFKLGYPPEAMLYVEMVLYFLTFIARLNVLRKIAHLNVLKFLHEVTFRELATVLLSTIFVAMSFLLFKKDGWSVLVRMATTFFVALICSLYIGFKSQERKWIFTLIKEKLPFKKWKR